MEDFNSIQVPDNYYVKLGNLHHGVHENKSHLFDIFAQLKREVDSTFTRIDMLNFVADNNSRYMWDAHLFFKMHDLNRKKQFILFLSSQSAKSGHQNLFINSV